MWVWTMTCELRLCSLPGYLKKILEYKTNIHHCTEKKYV